MTFTRNYTGIEMEKLRITQKLDDEVVTVTQASEALEVSERTMYRYLKALREEGPPGLIHGLKGKPSNFQPHHGKLNGLRKYVMLKKFEGFGPTLLSESLEELYGFTVNKETLRLRMIKRGVRKDKKRRQEISRTLRERRPQYGMLLQFDGSYHDWLENGEIRCLLASVDDATSDLTYGVFAQGESLEDVVGFRSTYMKKHGKPKAIYVDCHASYKVNHPQDQFDEEMKTRFEKGMNKLGIDVIFAKSPEGKGRVERCFKTHQDRLIKSMRLKGIASYEEANKYLDEEYRKKYNQKFGKQAAEPGDVHEVLTQEEVNNLIRYFGIQAERKVKNDGTIRYKKHRYQLEKGQVLCNQRIITICESMHGEIRLYSGEKEICFKEVRVK